MHEENQRGFTRVETHMKVELTDPEGTRVTGEASDVSMKGLFLHCAERPAPGTPCSVALWLNADKEAICIQAKGSVSRSEEDGIAVEFTGIEGESLAHLRRLVLYNAQTDLDTVEEELDTSVGIRPGDEA